MLKIYGIKNCSTMKKAFDALTKADLRYEFHDYKKTPIDAETLQDWLEQINSALILNKKGTTWRKLSEDEQNFALENQDNLIQTLIAHPSMIKRPVLVNGQQILVGFDEAQYLALAKN